jgi:peroxiredoxin family protein
MMAIVSCEYLTHEMNIFFTFAYLNVIKKGMEMDNNKCCRQQEQQLMRTY